MSKEHDTFTDIIANGFGLHNERSRLPCHNGDLSRGIKLRTFIIGLKEALRMKDIGAGSFSNRIQLFESGSDEQVVVVEKGDVLSMSKPQADVARSGGAPGIPLQFD